MKLILSTLFALLLVGGVEAQTLRYCQTLTDVTNGNASANGTVVALTAQNIKALSGVATATPVSGTTPTMDLKIQTCYDSTTTKCKDFITFDQCTTSACWTNGIQTADVNRDTVNWFKYFRAVSTLGGTSPVYTYKVQLCFDGTK